MRPSTSRSRAGRPPRKHPFPDEPVPPTVYVTASPGISQRAKIEKGVKIILVPDIRWTRCDIKSISLLPNVLANQQAKENNAEEAVFVRDGVITEGSHTNFFMIFGGRVLTHPLNSHILPGITRDIIRDLCGELKIPFQEELVSEKDLAKAEEMFLSGTSMEVTPVIQVDEWKVGKGMPGPLTSDSRRPIRICWLSSGDLEAFETFPFKMKRFLKKSIYFSIFNLIFAICNAV